ncbi:GNAT family N-acetyltransferase [bacterium]|nr:GNAT family N-acetyltransferase [bacterium]
MRIRRARGEDISRLVDLWLAMMGEHEAFELRLEVTDVAGPAYQNYLLLHLRGVRSRLLVAEEEGRIIGFSCAYISQNLPMFAPAVFGYISDIYVLPEWQGQGVGKGLMRETTEYFRSLGVETVQLQVYEHNEKGKAFWKSLGFEPFFQRMWLNLEEKE